MVCSKKLKHGNDGGDKMELLKIIGLIGGLTFLFVGITQQIDELTIAGMLVIVFTATEKT